MPNIITGHNDVLIVLGATNGGWCIYAGNPDNTATEILETSPAAALSDDEGLIEWFADQLALPTPELQARPPNPEPEAKPAEHGAPPVGGDDQVKHMVDRFLSWRLPENFYPDAGITFDAIGNRGTSYEFTREPSGTNLFDAVQAEAMVRHMMTGLPTGQSKGEEDYRRYRASIPVEFGGTREDLERALGMFENWMPDALPANDAGQIHFARAVGESLADAVKAYLAQPAATDIGQLAAEHMTAILTLADIRKALKPFATWAAYLHNAPDDTHPIYHWDERAGDIVEISAAQVRALMSAAGMFTDEMRPPEATAPVASTEQAGAVPPPATPDEIDQLEVVDVGAADDDDGLF
jgi:hypothetical protein